MNILGLKTTFHDTGAALLSNDKVVAISEERLDRIKHSKKFPKLSIKYCLDALGLKEEDIDLIMIDQVQLRSKRNMKHDFLKWDKAQLFKNAKIEIVNHYDAHAASAFFCSPFREAAILIYDGNGEKYFNQFGVPAVETEAFFYGQDNKIINISRTTNTKINGKFPYTFGIGRLYAFMSNKYINFGGQNEGKMMGLASYGDDRILRDFPEDMWYKEYMGQIYCNSQISFPNKKTKTVKRIKKNIKNIIPFIKWKIRVLIKKIANKFLKFAYRSDDIRFYTKPDIFEPIKLSRPARTDEKLPDKYYASVAYAMQYILERIAIILGRKVKKITRSENICIAGGVGLNIDANRNFLDKVGFKNIFVQPGASDSGIPLGCALHGFYVLGKFPRSWEMKKASLGRLYSDREIELAIEKNIDKIVVKKSSNVCSEVAQFIADGNIVGWFHGGSEYGPRALGNRSIVCDARKINMRDILNEKVKNREMWRPFATSVLFEHMSEWFDIKYPSPFMLIAAQVVEEKKKKIPSLVHVDGTCRIQSVTEESNAKYYKLINEFKKITGVPLILNTSFNLGGEPIVETPENALDTFLRTKMDYLVLEDFIVSKKI